MNKVVEVNLSMFLLQRAKKTFPFASEASRFQLDIIINIIIFNYCDYGYLEKQIVYSVPDEHQQSKPVSGLRNEIWSN